MIYAFMFHRCRQALARSCRLLLKASQVILGTPSVRFEAVEINRAVRELMISSEKPNLTKIFGVNRC